MEILDDRGFVASLKSFREEAWDTLVERCGDMLYRYAFHLAGDDAGATEDIVQETFHVAVKAIRRFDPEIGTLGGWLMGIARRIALQSSRAKKPLRLSPDLAALEQTADILEHLEEQKLPEEILLAKEFRCLCGVALSSLPSQYVRVLTMKYLDDLSVDAIAQRLESSGKSVESMLARARDALRTALAIHAREYLDEIVGANYGTP